MLAVSKSKVALYSSFILLSTFVLFQSCFVPFSYAIPGIDVDIFVYNAKCMLNGDLLYKDVFDHKGPILYLINALALFLFSENTLGIWFFQIISLSLTLVFLYKIATLFSKNKLIIFFSVFSVLLFLVPLSLGNNSVQEWSLPYISLALYLFLRKIINKEKFSYLDLFLISFSFLLTFFLQANLIVVWIVFALIIFVKLLREKKTRKLFIYFVVILSYLILLTSPFLIYLYQKDLLKDFYYGVFAFNTGNYIDKSFIGISKNVIKELLGLAHLPFLVVLYLIFSFFKSKENKYIFWGIFLSLFLSVIFCSIGNNYRHYYMVYAPLLVFPYVGIYQFFYDRIKKHKYLLVSLVFVLHMIFPMYSWSKSIMLKTVKIEKGKVSRNIDTQILTKDMQGLIDRYHINLSDKILVYGNRNYFYLSSGLYASSKYSYVTPIIDNNEKIESEYFQDLENSPPSIFIYQIDNGCEERINRAIKDYLKKNYFIHNIDLSYLGKYGEVEIWIKNEYK